MVCVLVVLAVKERSFRGFVSWILAPIRVILARIIDRRNHHRPVATLISGYFLSQTGLAHELLDGSELTPVLKELAETVSASS